MEKKMIKLKEISLKRNGKAIFNNFNLNIAPRERVVIVGESGSGKSTLLRLIAGLEYPDRGEIYIESREVTKDREILIEPYKRNLNMLFQDLALWTHLSVEGNISFGLKVQKVAKEKISQKVKEMLVLVGLEGYEKRAIETLSGGEQQRVALARALVTNPKIVLMDEPLSSLDSQRRGALSRKIVELQKLFGFTLLYVTHSQKEAEYIATKVVPL
jgi:ABC-type Fe3+/spermidine/putrescine transport system ATPase subunit